VDALVFVLLGFAAVLGIPVLAWGLQRRTQVHSWRMACERAGLHDIVTHPGFVLGPEVTGRSGPLGIRISHGPHDVNDLSSLTTAVQVEGHGRPVGTLGLVAERALTPAGHPTPEMQVGDPAFDHIYWVTGSPAVVRAQLDSDLRRRFCVQDGWGPTDLSRGRVRTLLDPAAGVERVAGAIHGLLDLAQRLAEPMDVPARLADLASGDPLPGVRRETLRALLREYADHPRTGPTLREAALRDPDPEVRLRAAMALGPDGSATLTAIAGDPEMDDATAASAVLALDRRLTADQAREVLDEALRRRRMHTARACLERLGRGPAPETLERLLEVMAVEKGELAPCAARAVGRLGAPAAEPALLAALDRDVPGLRPDAAEALGRVGTVAAVLPLKEAAERWHGEGDFPRLARQAVAAIQARAAGARQGQLTLTDDARGRVSMAEGTAGQLSVPPAEPGQVSVARGTHGGP
jgi:HEAT repeat protein